MKITNSSQLEDGMRASCVFNGGRLTGVITIEGAFAYLCQNKIDGAKCKDLKGYKYSVWIIDDIDLMAHGVSDIETIPTKKTKKVVKPVEPVYTEITSVDQLYDGMPVKVTWLINSGQIDGEITIEGDNVFICQDDRVGRGCKDKKGYSHSWIIKEGDVSWLRAMAGDTSIYSHCYYKKYFDIKKLEGVLKATTIATPKTDTPKITKSRPEATSYMWDGILYLKDTIGGRDVKLLEAKLDELKIQVGRWHHLFDKKG